METSRLGHTTTEDHGGELKFLLLVLVRFLSVLLFMCVCVQIVCVQISQYLSFFFCLFELVFLLSVT